MSALAGSKSSWKRGGGTTIFMADYNRWYTNSARIRSTDRKVDPGMSGGLRLQSVKWRQTACISDFMSQFETPSSFIWRWIFNRRKCEHFYFLWSETCCKNTLFYSFLFLASALLKICADPWNRSWYPKLCLSILTVLELFTKFWKRFLRGKQWTGYSENPSRTRTKTKCR